MIAKIIFTTLLMIHEGYLLNSDDCISLDDVPGNFTSPNYPEEYDNRMNVCWNITAPIGMCVWFIPIDVDVEVDYDEINFYSDGGLKRRIYHAISPFRICGNDVEIEFDTDNTATRTGFLIKYAFVSQSIRIQYHYDIQHNSTIIPDVGVPRLSHSSALCCGTLCNTDADCAAFIWSTSQSECQLLTHVTYDVINRLEDSGLHDVYIKEYNMDDPQYYAAGAC